MRIPTICLKSVLLLTAIAAPINAMYKKPHNPFEQDMQRSKQSTRVSLFGNRTGKQKQDLCLTKHPLNDQPTPTQTRQQKPQQKVKQAQKPAQGPCLTRRSFHDLPTHIQIHVADYLGYHDQFRLAQTSREQLFLWGSVTRVPESVPLITATSDVTRFNWDDAVWPTTVHPTVIIQLDRSLEDDEELFGLQRLGTVNLRSILHLHFDAESRAHEELSMNIDMLVQRNDFSENLNNLLSLTFHWITPVFGIGDDSLQNLSTFTVNGRAIERQRGSEIFSSRTLLAFRTNLRNIFFYRAQMGIRGIEYLLDHLRCIEGQSERHVEIRENSLSYTGINTSSDGSQGIDYRLRPWVISPQGDIRVHYRHDRIVSGPARLMETGLRGENGQPASWPQLFTHLSRRVSSITELLPILRARSLQARLDVVFSILNRIPLVRQLLTLPQQNVKRGKNPKRMRNQKAISGQETHQRSNQNHYPPLSQFEKL